MRYLLLGTSFVIVLMSCVSEPGVTIDLSTNFVKMQSPKEHMTANDEQLPSVTMVGTFHFDYPNLDAHIIDSSDMVDVLNDIRQQEMQELLDYLATFKPNKIVIESTNPERFNNRYHDFLEGNFELGRDERYQLGFALGKRFGLDTLYCLDAGAFANEFGNESCPVLDSVFVDYDFRSDDPVEQKVIDYLNYREDRLKEMTLLEYLSDMNTEESWNFNYGSYLIGDFKLGELRGTDALATYWYSRNLRIFRKIQMITESADDRILVIFGNGHVSILHQLFKCTPEYDYVPFGQLM